MMKLTTVRNGKGQTIGNTTAYLNGDVVARDRGGKVLGHASVAFNHTRDSDGRLTSTNSADANSLFHW